MKKIISLAICLAMLLTLAVSATAATVENKTPDHSYVAYQIFTGTQADGQPNLGAVQWGAGVDGDGLLAYLQGIDDRYDAFTTAADVANFLAITSENSDREADARAFADAASKYVNTDAVEGTGKFTIPAGTTEFDLPAGYYLLVDTTVFTPDEDGTLEDARNTALLQVTNRGTIEIKKKYDVPTHEKHLIQDSGEHGEHEERSIGDTVEFHLKGNLPNNFGAYTKYKYVFHDKMSDGLTFDADSVQVFVGGNTDEYLLDNTGNQYYTVVTDCEDGCTFEILFNDMTQVPGAANNAWVYVKYAAILNENAVVNGTGNPNESRLEFSNDPNWEPDDSTGENEPVGVTPWQQVVVYTTEIIINKVNDNGDKLTGAAFRIEGDSANIVVTTGQVFVPYVDGDPAPTKFWKLTDGTYTTTDPATEGIDTSKYASTTDIYMMKDEAALDTTGENAVYAEAFVNEDGQVIFSGLGEGTFTITEIVAPEGYNPIAPMTVTIEYNGGSFQYLWSNNETGSTIDIVNSRGSVLPETGGIGTTLFYVIGGLLAVGSVVLLVTKKRMTAE